MKKCNILSPYTGALSFKSQELDAEDVQSLLQAALATTEQVDGNTCEIYVTDNRELLERLADAREHGAESLRQAPMALAIVADRLYDGAWVENCSTALWAMHVRATELGLACQAIQIRGYSLTDGVMSDDVVRGILGIPDGKTVYALLAVGYASRHDCGSEECEVDWGRVHLV